MLLLAHLDLLRLIDSYTFEEYQLAQELKSGALPGFFQKGSNQKICFQTYV
jgi:hypothetical protein